MKLWTIYYLLLNQNAEKRRTIQPNQTLASKISQMPSVKRIFDFTNRIFIDCQRPCESLIDSTCLTDMYSMEYRAKDQFPALMSELVRNTSTFRQNVKSGFRKCGIYPLSDVPFLQRLPHVRPHHVDKEFISGVVLDKLSELRSDKDSGTRKRAKRVDVEPGKSVSDKDMDTATATYGNG